MISPRTSIASAQLKSKRLIRPALAILAACLALVALATPAAAKPAPPEERIAGVDLQGMDVDAYVLDSRIVAAGRVVCGLSAPKKQPMVLELAVRDTVDEARKDLEDFIGLTARELEPAANTNLALPPGAWVGVRGRAVGVVAFAQTNVFVAIRGASGVAEVAREVHRRLLAAPRVAPGDAIERPELEIRTSGPLAPGDEHLLDYEARDPAQGALELVWRSDRATLVPDGADCWFRADEPGSYSVELTAISELNLVGKAEVTIEVR